MEDLEKLRIIPYDRWPLPVCSPDMHQTIEHVHSILSSNVKARLLSSLCKPERYADVLEEESYKLSTTSIQLDVQSLKKTYREIVRLEGDWPLSKFR